MNYLCLLPGELLLNRKQELCCGLLLFLDHGWGEDYREAAGNTSALDGCVSLLTTGRVEAECRGKLISLPARGEIHMHKLKLVPIY